MKRTLIRYGFISAGILVGVNVIVLLLLGIPGPDDYAVGEVIGYSTIIVALVPVFFGIRFYRNEVAGGTLSFTKGVGVGLAIAGIPSLAFALYNLVYVTWIDPDFAESYMQYTLDSARAEMSPAEYQQYAAQVEAQAAMFNDPFFQSLAMFMTVFLIGLVIAIVSAMVLRRTSSPASA